MAVPSVFVRSTAQKMKPFCKEGQLIVDVAKGIEENTLDTMTQIIKEELPMAETAVLSGPSHAEEVSRGLPTLCVAGSHKKKIAEYIQSTFISPVFRVYTSPDVLGIETGAALKNVVALAAGIADGLGYGDNAKAALITRGMAEIARLGVAMGGKYQTYTGLSGIGDLIVTCASMHSRNRRAGILIGKGYTMEEAMNELSVIAGQKAVMTRAKKSIAAFKLREGMPIGCRVTLRKERMWDFLDKLMNFALPRVRDFRGINPDAFDGRGNYNMGLKEQLIFPEIEYDKIDKVRGMDICFVTTATNDEEARELLTLMGAPFAK